MIYLAAPYSATTEAETEERMEVFSRVMARLIKDGEVVVSPLVCHYIRKHGDLPGDWNFWQDYSRTLLKSCSELVIIDMPGWTESTGVRGEINFAIEKQIPCSLYNCATNSRKPL
jgi:hypothetical protein